MNYFAKNFNYLWHKLSNSYGFRKKINASSFSELLGVSPSTITRWAKNERIPPPNTLNRIAIFFSSEIGIKITADDLLNRDLQNEKKYSNRISESQVQYGEFIEKFYKLSRNDRKLIMKIIERLLKNN